MPSGLATVSAIVARFGSPTFAGLNLSCTALAIVHGAWQLARDANCPICFERHARAAGAPVARSVRIAEASESDDFVGSKMNARSLTIPSPLTSDATSGVNRSPDVACRTVVRKRKLKIG